MGRPTDPSDTPDGDESGEAVSDSSAFALEQIRARLEPGVLGPDRKLPTERALSDELGVSRRAVRRALEVLSAEGRVWRRQGSGTYAGPAPARTRPEVSPDATPQDIMEVRLRVEPQIAELAAQRATAADIDRIRTLIEHIQHCTDADERELWDGALHRAIAEAARNPLFLALFDLIDHLRQDPRWVALREKARTPEIISGYTTQHDEIIAAIEAGDSSGAGLAMRRHLTALKNNLGRALRANFRIDG